jgi:hypothetical protein
MAAYTTIDDPSAYFKVQLYTGNGSTNAITFDDTDTNMQPDFVWLKNRNSSAHDHFLFNSVDGVQKFLSSNDTGALSSADSSYLTAFGSDGFTLGSSDGMNESGITFVSWNWKESATAGFDMVGYTGTGSSADVSHSLSAVPEVIFTKRKEDTQDWFVFTTGTGATDALFLNKGDGEDTSQSNAYDAAPTSSVINYGNDNACNGSSETYTAFLWRSVQGYSKMGTYVGNASSNGTYVHCGFLPAMIISKKTSGTSDWIIWDNKRDGHNETLKRVYPNDPANEENSTTQGVDFLSNGFKLRGTNSNAWNASGGTYFFMAFAESPFVNSNGVPNNAK